MGNDISKGTGRATGRVVDGRAGWDADRKADGSAAGRGRRAVHNAFRDIGTGRYHFKLDDRIAAEMVKAYLRTMEVQEAIRVLQGIVDPRVIQLDFSRGHTGCQKALWTDVNGIRLAELIDRAKGIMAEKQGLDRGRPDTEKDAAVSGRRIPGAVGGKVCQLHAGGICGIYHRLLSVSEA